MPHKTAENPKLYPDPKTGHKKIGLSWYTLRKGGESDKDADWNLASDLDIAALEGGGNDTGTPDYDEALDTYTGNEDTGIDFATSWATWKDAYDAAQARGLRVGYVEVGADGAATPISGDYDITMKNSEFFINPVGESKVTGGKSYSIQVSPINGDIIAINRADPQDVEVVQSAPTSPPMGSNKLGEPMPNGDGSFTQAYEVVDSQNRRRIHYVKLAAANVTPTEKDIITFDKDDGGGRLIPLGGGKYTYEPPEDEPFTTKASDVVPLPAQGGSLIKTSANQYQFVRDTFDPGRKVDETGREYLQQIDGSWSELAPRFEPELMRADGMNLFQQRSGQVSQLTPPNMDDIITQALIDGDVDKALAFQDFRDRPTAQEAFQTALDFARSPADQRIISAIARGITPVQPPPEGTIQRVGPQPDFLIKEYEDYQRRTQAGRAPTGEEIAGASEDPTLQARLESIASKDRREEEKHSLFITSEEGKQRRAQEAFDTQQTTKAAEAAVKNAAAAAAAGDTGDTGAADAGEETARVIQPGTRVKQEGTTTMVNAKGEVRNIATESTKQFEGAGWEVITEEELQAADIASATEAEDIAAQTAADAEIAQEELQAAGDTRAAEFEAALAAGFRPEDYNMIGGRAIEAHQAAMEAQPGIDARDAINTALDLEGRGVRYSGVSMGNLGDDVIGGGPPAPDSDIPSTLTGFPEGTTWNDINAQVLAGVGNPKSNSASAKQDPFYSGRAGGGTVRPGEITVVGEKGPEIAMMPPGTHILPLGKATKKDIKKAQASGRAYQEGGIVFGDLEPGLQQLQRGRPITPPRGYLFQQGGLTMPSAQALQNLTPGTRASFYGMAGDIGISPEEFRQELQTATPGGTRLPTSRMLPLGRRGVR